MSELLRPPASGGARHRGGSDFSLQTRRRRHRDRTGALSSLKVAKRALRPFPRLPVVGNSTTRQNDDGVVGRSSSSALHHRFRLRSRPKSTSCRTPKAAPAMGILRMDVSRGSPHLGSLASRWRRCSQPPPATAERRSTRRRSGQDACRGGPIADAYREIDDNPSSRTVTRTIEHDYHRGKDYRYVFDTGRVHARTRLVHGDAWYMQLRRPVVLQTIRR